ncbi:MAG: urea ABC transporter substrate-binding protein [Chloroflexi bacterium]|nr:urea ABC transporter substrate-binding protein [Chloroflexota bacterium]
MISRRRLFRLGAGAAAFPVLGALLNACGGSSAPASSTAAPSSGTSSAGAASSGDLKVGIMHSLSGVMSISEKAVVDAEQLAIAEINAAGGVNGKKMVPIVEDGASDPATFAEKAKKLVQSDKVPVVFGCWTSSSRKAVRPVFKGSASLLFYPVQYEGLEMDSNIYYIGATTNQQIVPSVEYLMGQGKKNFFLLGSDYVFPRTANGIIKAQVGAAGGKILGEEYVPLSGGSNDFSTVISKIKSSGTDIVYNTLNGDSNVAFFKQLRDAGLTADKLTTCSVSIAEEEARAIGGDILKDHLVAWNYYQTTKLPANDKFVAAYKAKFGANRVTGDPIEAAYTGVYLWSMAANKAKSTDVAEVRKALSGLTFEAPEGTVTVSPKNNHISKTFRMGKIRTDGLIDEIYATPKPVEPDPFLETYPWAKEFAKQKPAS